MKLPDELTIALATSLVASKPSGVSISNFVQALRKHVTNIQKFDTLSSRSYHVDQSSYWQSEYRRMEQSRNEIQNLVSDLRRQVESFQSGVEIQQPVEKDKKRKNGKSRCPLSPKRRKSAVRPTETQMRTMTLEEVCGSIRNSESGQNFMSSVYEIQFMLSGKPRADMPTLGFHLCRAAKTASELVRIAVKAASSDTTTSQIEPLVSSLKCIMPKLIYGYDKFYCDSGNAEMRGRVLHAYISMYACFLDSLEDVAIAAISHWNRKLKTHLHQTRSRTFTRSTEQSESSGRKHITALNAFSSFACDIIDDLDPQTHAHGELFEGFAYLVLSKIGSRLYRFVFGQSRRPTLEAEIAAITRSDCGDKFHDTTPLDVENEQLQVARIEAPHLIRILSKIMLTAPSYLGEESTRSTHLQTAPDSCLTRPSRNLAIAARDRLQRTLVNGIFGLEGLGNKSFADCLQMPATDGTPLPVPDVKEKDVGAWFGQEVWQLLGWDILSKDHGG